MLVQPYYGHCRVSVKVVRKRLGIGWVQPSTTSGPDHFRKSTCWAPMGPRIQTDEVANQILLSGPRRIEESGTNAQSPTTPIGKSNSRAANSVLRYRIQSAYLMIVGALSAARAGIVHP